MKPGSLEIEQAAKAADLGIGAGARRSAHQRLDQFHHAVAGIDIDAGGRVACLIHEATNSDQKPPGGEALLGPPTSESPGAQARGRRYIVVLQRRRAGRSIGSGLAERVAEPGRDLSIPNLITLGRILLVPVVVWAITSGEMRIAFLLFLAPASATPSTASSPSAST